MKTTTQTRARTPRMQLSDGQLRPLWRLLDSAWKRHCAEAGIDAPTTAAKEEWRHEQLRLALGVRSLKEVRRSGDQYARLMAHLEVIARDGIRWQCAADGAEVRPLVFAILALVEEHQLDEHYVCGIARQMLGAEEMPALDKLTPAQLQKLHRILETKAATLAAKGAR